MAETSQMFNVCYVEHLNLQHVLEWAAELSQMTVKWQ